MGKFFNKIIHIFFEEENGTTEKRQEEDREYNNFVRRAFSTVFFINAALTIYLFFKGRFEIYNTLHMITIGLTIGIGIAALYYDWEIERNKKH